MYRTYFFLFACLLLAVQSKGQEASTLLERIADAYKNRSAFHNKITYAMFHGDGSTKASESYSGYIIRKDGTTVMKILNAEVAQFPEAQIVVDNDQKTITYSPSEAIAMEGSPLEVSEFLKFYTETSRKTIGNTIVLNMALKHNEAPLPYKKISLHIDRNTLEVQKQILYFSSKALLSNPSITPEAISRLEITLKPLAMAQIPSLKHYIVTEGSANMRPAASFANYQLIDQTQL